MGTKIHRRIQKEWKVNIKFSESVEEEDEPEAVNTEIIDGDSYHKKFDIVNVSEDKNKRNVLPIVRAFIKKHKKPIMVFVTLAGFISSAITIYQFIS